MAVPKQKMIVVPIDGSENSLRSLDWDLPNRPLRLSIRNDAWELPVIFVIGRRIIGQMR